jgi:hypothetical protein
MQKKTEINERTPTGHFALHLPVLAAALIAGAGMPPAALAWDWQVVNLHPPGPGNSYGYAGFGPQQGGDLIAPSPVHPVVWNSIPQSVSSLLPPGFSSGNVRGMHEGSQVGGVTTSLPGGGTHGAAALWYGTAASFQNLHPAGYGSSIAYGVRGNQQVGYVLPAVMSASPQAALWQGTASSFVSLHPANAIRSWAYATDGERQGGYAYSHLGYHAAIWNGSPQYINLNPPGSNLAEIRAMAPGAQAGFARLAGELNPFAAVWRGTAESYINMNPTGSGRSEIHGTTGQFHVGGAWFASLPDAILWYGDRPDDYINLHALLPGSPGTSFARAVSVVGDRIYIVGDVSYGAPRQAVLWIGTIPSPSAAITILGGLAALAHRRRRPAP